jgi:hypothetical protein
LRTVKPGSSLSKLVRRLVTPSYLLIGYLRLAVTRMPFLWRRLLMERWSNCAIVQTRQQNERMLPSGGLMILPAGRHR